MRKGFDFYTVAGPLALAVGFIWVYLTMTVLKIPGWPGMVGMECGRWRFVPVCGRVGAVVGGCFRRRLLGLKVGARRGRGDVVAGACSVVSTAAAADGVP